MDSIPFSKWQGTGNDFILVDDRSGAMGPLVAPQVERMCDRHFGIGSDGLILLQAAREAGDAYHMEFFNPDGSQSFCGNGSRCTYAFWSRLAGSREAVRFTAIDGRHEAGPLGEQVSIGMRDVAPPEVLQEGVLLFDTGSPHLLITVPDPQQVDIVREARQWRYNERFKAKGVNVNFVHWDGSTLHMRTYERGVEDETLSCGTGVTAGALGVMHAHGVSGPVRISTAGGALEVHAQRRDDGGYMNVRLVGPALPVYEGVWPGGERG